MPLLDCDARSRAATRLNQGRPLTLTPQDRRAYTRNLHKFYLYRFIWYGQLYTPIWVAFLLEDKGFSLTQVTLLDGPFWLTIVFAGIPAGALADRWGRARAMTLALVIFAATLVGFVYAPTYPLVLLTFLSWGVAFALVGGAESALVYDTLKALGREREYERILGRGAAVTAVALLFGTIVGGPVADLIGQRATILIGSGALAAAALLTLSLHEPPHREPAQAPLSYLSGARAGLRIVWQQPALRYVIPFAAVVTAATFAVDVFIQPFLLSHGIDVGWKFSLLQIPPRLVGILGAIAAFYAVAKLGEGRTIPLLPALAVLAYVGLTLVDALPALVFLALLTFLQAAALPIVTGYINRRIPSAQRATVLSLHQLTFALILAPMLPGIGIAADEIDLQAGFTVAAAVLAGLALVTGTLWARAHRRSVALRPAFAATPLEER